jgi:hypothetical protein
VWLEGKEMRILTVVFVVGAVMALGLTARASEHAATTPADGRDEHASAVSGEARDAHAEAENWPGPRIAAPSAWPGAMVLIVLGMFAAAAAVGVAVRANMPQDNGNGGHDAHGHDSHGDAHGHDDHGHH